jgi:hypothetical protein
MLELISLGTGPTQERVLDESADAGGTRAVIASLAAEDLVRVRPVRGRDAAETYHDRIREFVATELSAARRQELHRRLAEALQTHEPDEVEALTHHFSAASDNVNATRYGLKAAVRAEEQLAFERAANFFGEALRTGTFEADERTRWLERRARCLVNAGHVHDAGQAFLESASGAAGRHRMDLLRLAAAQFLIGGYLDEGAAALEEVLRATHVRPVRGRLLLVLAIVFWRIRVSLLFWRLGGKYEPVSQPDEDRLLRIDACHAVSTGHGLIDLAQSALFQHRATYHALKDGDAFRMVRAIMGEVAYSSTGGTANSERTRMLRAQARSVLDEYPSSEGEAIWFASEVMVASNEGRWKDSLDLSGPSLERLRAESGLNWEIMAVQLFRLWGLALAGDFDRLRRDVAREIDDARSRGNRQAETLFVTGPAQIGWFAGGELERAEEERLRSMEGWSHDGFHLQHAYVMLATVNGACVRGDAEAAWAAAKEHWPRLKRSLLIYHHQFGILSSSVLARAAVFYLHCGTNEVDKRLASRLLKGWLRRVESAPEGFAIGLGCVLRAEMAARDDDVPAATKHLQDARKAFEHEQHPIDLVAARVGVELLAGQEGAACEELRQLGVADPRQYARLNTPVIATRF